MKIDDTSAECCANQLNWINDELCKARSTSTYTNKYYVDYQGLKCVKDCEGCGDDGESLMDFSTQLFDTADLCCSTKLGWLDAGACVADTNNGVCLQAKMTSSNGGTYPNAEGYVTVCFDGALSETSGSLRMNVKGLKVSTTGGVHIHTGKSSTPKTGTS